MVRHHSKSRDPASDLKPRPAVVKTLSYFFRKILVTERMYEEIPPPVVRGGAVAAPRAHFSHPRFPNRHCLPE